MTLQQRGHDYDNELAVALDEGTDARTRALPMRGSGNIGIPAADVLVTTPTVDHYIEAKKHSWDTDERGASLNPEDCEELAACHRIDAMVWYAVKFSHRELLVVGPLDPDISAEPADGIGVSIQRKAPSCFGVSYTDAGYVRLRKPDTEEWPSAQAGREDSAVLIDELDLRRNDE